MKKILVVEDSKITRLYLRRILESAGYEVFEAVSGEQVINDFFHRHYSLQDMDLIILDFYLKDMDGLEVLKRIVHKISNIPVVILSCEKKKKNVLECIEMGVSDYIIKPFDEKIFISRIRRILPVQDKGNKKQVEEVKVDEEYTVKNFKNILVNEIDRAIRTETPLILVRYKFRVKKDILEKIHVNTAEKLRAIDHVFRIKNDIILILPITDKKGEAIVEKKLLESWKGVEEITNKPDIKKVFFPDDIENKKLIRDYKKEEIRDIILKKIELNF